MSMERDPNEREQPRLTRRRVLEGVGAAIVAAGAGGLALTLKQYAEDERTPNTSEQFNDLVSGFRAQYTLKYNEIQFVDENNRPIGNPVPLEDIDGISPGTFKTFKTFDDALETRQILEGRMNQEWLNAARARVCRAHPEIVCDDTPNEERPRQLNTIEILRGAQNPEDEQGFYPDTFMDIVTYYGSKEVLGDERKRSRIRFVEETISEAEELPESIRAELGRLAVGLAAQESQFNNSAKSKDGAMGIFQFMPDTWRELGYKESDITSLQKQVRGAVKHFHRVFVSLQREKSSLDMLATYFSDEKEFAKMFLVPAMLSAYHAGDARIASMIRVFTKEIENNEELRKTLERRRNALGYDLYDSMARFAFSEKDGLLKNFGRHSYEYVPRIFAIRQLLDGNTAQSHTQSK